VNPTNGSSYTWTILQTQQVASSRLRAVETGRWVLQAAPTGFSAIIDNDGQVLARTGISETAVLRDDIELRRGHTLYTRLGDGPIVAIIVLAALGPAITTAVRAAAALRVRGSQSPARR
jgi:apolipoprotein N-acyltransferase